jgi:hypothetical protein
VVSTPVGLTGTCGSGTISAAAGAQVISLSGGSIAASSSCAFALNVTAVSAGNQVNTTGNVTSANGGTGNTATASITVLAPDLTISKTHTGSFFQGQTNASYAITVANVGAGPSAGVVTVSEIPPASLAITSLTGTGWACSVSTLSCTRSDALAANASYPAITVVAAVGAAAPGSIINAATVMGGGELNLGNDSASDAATTTAPPDFTLSLASSSQSVIAGGSATYKITVTPQNAPFSAPITFRISGLPPKSTFSLNPATVTLGTSPKSVVLTVVTSEGDPFVAHNSRGSRGPMLALLLPISGILFSAFGARKRSMRRGKVGWLLGVVFLFSCGVFLNGCGSVENFQRLGTPPGSYTVTVTATSGSTQHSVPVTLTVQP